jgi:hypothetical protein
MANRRSSAPPGRAGGRRFGRDLTLRFTVREVMPDPLN